MTIKATEQQQQHDKSSNETRRITPLEAYELLCTKARETFVKLENVNIADKPSWFDEARFAEGKKAIEKFFVGIQFSSFTGLLLILQLPDGLEPLLSTGNSKDVPSLFKRYLNTIIHVRAWYEDDVFDSSTRGYKSIRQVRSMHKRVQNLMNNKFTVAKNSGNSGKWMNQYEMVLTQFAFIGLAMLYPAKCGCVLATNRELEVINYYWRVLGHLMGIDDEFNYAQFDSYEDIREFSRLILENEFKAVFKRDSCPKGLAMTQAITLALQYYLPLVTFNNLAHWWKDQFKFNGYEPQPQTLHEKMLYSIMKMIMKKFMKSKTIVRYSTNFNKKFFDLRFKKREKVYAKLTDRYKDSKEYCFYSDRVDYFSKPHDYAIVDEFVDVLTNSANTKTAISLPTGGCPFLAVNSATPAAESCDRQVLTVEQQVTPVVGSN